MDQSHTFFALRVMGCLLPSPHFYELVIKKVSKIMSEIAYHSFLIHRRLPSYIYE